MGRSSGACRRRSSRPTSQWASAAMAGATSASMRAMAAAMPASRRWGAALPGSRSAASSSSGAACRADAQHRLDRPLPARGRRGAHLPQVQHDGVQHAIHAARCIRCLARALRRLVRVHKALRQAQRCGQRAAARKRCGQRARRARQVGDPVHQREPGLHLRPPSTPRTGCLCRTRWPVRSLWQARRAGPRLRAPHRADLGHASAGPPQAEHCCLSLKA